MDIRTYIKDHLLLFDGAMGTLFQTEGGEGMCELANLSDPETILHIHQEYLMAGAKALKTNTFSASRLSLGDACAQVVEAGWRLAVQTAGGTDAYVFADLGPVSREADAPSEYQYLAGLFLDLGAKHFLLETLPDLTGVLETAAYIKARDPEAFLLVSFAAQPDGFTLTGHLAKDLLREASADPNIDAVGINCICSAGHMETLMTQIGPQTKPLSVMPNAGYPTVLGRKTIYQGDPDYFGQHLRALSALGAGILGGCCGTTPDHIAQASVALRGAAPRRISFRTPEVSSSALPAENPFWDALCDPNRKPIAVELDPPEAADVAKFMAGARELQRAGAAIITIADCPIARARMDSSLLACKLQRELGVQALPHMTCRDRNLNATKALLLGLCAEGVRNVLTVTGDPIPSARRDEVKSVYNFNSRMLARFITNLSDTSLPAPFRVFGALNVNARNFDVQLQLARDKQENGVLGFLTQPVLTAQAVENLKKARDTLDGKLLGGIIPIVSHRNAVFMNSEVSGITVDEGIIARYEGLDRAAGEDLAVEISLDAARKIAPWVDGFYLITPFGRTGLMARIMDQMRKEGLV